VAVVASLIFVGWQIKDNTEAQYLQEVPWACFHIRDRTQGGIFPEGTFELTGGGYLRDVLTTTGGGTWWRSAKHVGFIPEFVRAVDALLAKSAESTAGQAKPLHSLVCAHGTVSRKQ
jgi:hypothetical protein